jgi:hypothetical protein
MEYQLLFDVLVLAGLSATDALAWLHGVRRTGLERRFTTRAVGTGYSPTEQVRHCWTGRNHCCINR